jgi:hypothetical protein
MFMAHGCWKLEAVEAGIGRDTAAHATSCLDQVEAQVGVARLGQAAVFGDEVTRIGLGQPEARQLGDGIFDFPQGAEAGAFVLLFLLLGCEEAVQVADLGDDADARDALQTQSFRVASVVLAGALNFVQIKRSERSLLFGGSWYVMAVLLIPSSVAGIMQDICYLGDTFGN